MPDPESTITRSRTSYNVISRLARTKLAVVFGIVYLGTDLISEFPDANTAVWIFLGSCAVAISYNLGQSLVDWQKEKNNDATPAN